MIKLDVEYYCQHDCPYFEPIRETRFDEVSRDLISKVTCKNKFMCADLYKRFTAIDKAASINPDSCE